MSEAELFLGVEFLRPLLPRLTPAAIATIEKWLATRRRPVTSPDNVSG